VQYICPDTLPRHHETRATWCTKRRHFKTLLSEAIESLWWRYVFPLMLIS